MDNEEVEKEGFVQKNLVCILLLVLVLVLLLPLMGWQYWSFSSEYETVSEELRETRHSFHKERIKGLLASALFEAQRGRFELALQDMSSFFTTLNDEIAKADEGAFLPGQRSSLKALFGRRDETIASLARRDSQSISRLTNIYLFYLRTTGDARQSVGQIEVDQNQENTNTGSNSGDSNTNVEKQEPGPDPAEGGITSPGTSNVNSANTNTRDSDPKEKKKENTEPNENNNSSGFR